MIRSTLRKFSHHTADCKDHAAQHLSGHTIIRPRSRYPSFKAKAVQNGQIFDLNSEDYTKGWLVTFFYPLNFTFVCPTEIIAFSEAAAEFKKLHTKLLAVSCDSVHSHLAWLNMKRNQGGLEKLEFPLVADFSKRISQDFGFLVDDPKDDLFGVPLRGLVISNEKGIVKHVQANDAPVGRSVDEVLRLIQGFQFVEKNGEVCPANWKPGKSTIKPDHEKKKEFFSKEYN